jgi:hypothetical protein
MNSLTTNQIVSTRGSRENMAPAAFGSDARHAQHLSRDEQFVQMLDDYRGSGGLSRSGDISGLLEGAGRQTVGTVGRWMANKAVIHFEWQCLTWLPRFQFDMVARMPRAAVALVVAELGDSLDNWGMALWFAKPSSVLKGRVPADALPADPALVIEAARRDRHLSFA